MEHGDVCVCGWNNLPVEIVDSILHFVVTPTVKETSGIVLPDESGGLLMEVVLSSVCRTWWMRKTFWKGKVSLSRGGTTPEAAKSSLCCKAAEFGSISLLKWLNPQRNHWGRMTYA